MNAEQLERYICDTYSTEPEYLWAKYPSYRVFRHGSNRKWFALLMEISKEKLGLPEPGLIEVLDVKCEPLMIGSLRSEAGIFPAYHMSKASWITVALDGSVSDEKIRWLLEMSYDLTAKNGK